MGNFLSRFLHDAFLPADSGVRVDLLVGRDGFGATVGFTLPSDRRRVARDDLRPQASACAAARGAGADVDPDGASNQARSG